MTAIESTIVESVVFKKSEKGPLYLVLQRSSSEHLYPGMWQIVTGTVEPKEQPMAAALRELDEETSLTPVRFWVVPFVDAFFDRGTNSIQMCPLFAAEVDGVATPKLSSEHQKFEWVGLEAALELLVWPGHHKAVETVHHYVVAGRKAAALTEIDLTFAERKHP